MKEIVRRLKMIFPNLVLDDTMDFGTMEDDEDCFEVPCTITWYDFLEKLEENGLTIIEKKELKK